MWLSIHLAMAVAADLGLDRPAPPAKGLGMISLASNCHNDPSAKTPSPDETRGVLGCYILCSVYVPPVFKARPIFSG